MEKNNKKSFIKLTSGIEMELLPEGKILPAKKIEDLNFSFDEEKVDDGIQEAPKRKGIVCTKTKERNISARYKDGKFQAYDVSITLGREPRYDPEIERVVSHKQTIKKSFKRFEDAKNWRDKVKGEKAELREINKAMPNHLFTIDEVIEMYEDYLKRTEKSEDYISDKHRYGKHAKMYFTKANNKLNVVARIEKGDVENYLLFLKKEKKYAYKTLEKERAYIYSLWGYMLKWPVKFSVKMNVADGAKLPEPEKDAAGNEIVYRARDLNYKDVEELIKEACNLEDPSFLYLVVFSITQGLRRGELCGLKWSDIDFNTKIATIQHNRVQTVTSGRDREKRPKTGKIRKIELHKIGYETLCLYKAWQEEKLGRDVNPNDYVLQYEINLKYGYNPHTGKISRKWKETCTKINKERVKKEKPEIPYGRLHDGRHVYATLLLSGVKRDDGSIVMPASYIQVYDSMGHSLPKALANTTTTVYHEDSGERFTITHFWDELFQMSVKDEWQRCCEHRKEQWEKKTELQKDLMITRKQKRFEKAYQERLKNPPPGETEETYTEDGELTSFEEDRL